MRLVVFADGSKGAGWYHVSETGMMEGIAPPCEACIHRIEMDWPEEATRLDHGLFGGTEEGEKERPKYLHYLPSDKALYELLDKTKA